MECCGVMCCVVRWCVSDVWRCWDGCGWEGGWWMRFLFLVLECVCELADIVLRLRIVLTEMLCCLSFSSVPHSLYPLLLAFIWHFNTSNHFFISLRSECFVILVVSFTLQPLLSITFSPTLQRTLNTQYCHSLKFVGSQIPSSQKRSIIVF